LCQFFPQDLIEQVQGETLEEKLVLAWQQLQSDVDHLMDSGMNQSTQRISKVSPGIKQVSLVGFYSDTICLCVINEYFVIWQ
jgi:hypothetical protein